MRGWWVCIAFLAICALLGESKTMWGARRKREGEEVAKPKPALERAKKKGFHRRRATDLLENDSLFGGSQGMQIEEMLSQMDNYLNQVEIALRSKAFRDNFKPEALQSLSEAVNVPAIKEVLDSFQTDDVEDFVDKVLETVQYLRENKRELAALASDPAQLQSLLSAVPDEYSDLLQAFLRGDFESAQTALLRLLPREMRPAARAAFRGDFSLLKSALLNSDFLDDLDPQTRELIENALQGKVDPESASMLNEIQNLLDSPEELKSKMQNVIDSQEFTEVLEALQIPKDSLFDAEVLKGLFDDQEPEKQRKTHFAAA